MNKKTEKKQEAKSSKKETQAASCSLNRYYNMFLG